MRIETFNTHDPAPTSHDNSINTITTLVSNGSSGIEDFYFSTLWRDIGGKIFADLTSELSHLGKFSFYGSPSFNLKKN